MFSSYFKDLRAVDAKFEAQKIAFSPLCFWAVSLMLTSGFLRLVESYGEKGVCKDELVSKSEFDSYGVNLLSEIALGMGILKLANENEATQNALNSALQKNQNALNSATHSKNATFSTPHTQKATQNNQNTINSALQKNQNPTKEGKNAKNSIISNPPPHEHLAEFRLKLGKIGWFLLHDELTRVNFNFTRDICYDGAKELESSLKSHTPQGLRHFSTQWATIYEGLSQLNEPAKTSWFEFDHYYSDCVFPNALPLVFAKAPRLIYDIGGNTAKFALAACEFNAYVRVSILDLPSQTHLARLNIQKAGLQNRINTIDTDILDENSNLNGRPDAVWLSQFLDCFSLEQISFILGKIRQISDENTQIFVLEPLWDKQRYEAAAFSLQATSLYFTTMANGKSKMYGFDELREAVCAAGFVLAKAHHNLGANCYSLLEFKRA